MPPAALAIPPSAPIAVLDGPERFLQLDCTETLRAALTKKHGEISTFSFDGASARPAEILDECRSMSLMMLHKLIIVDNAERLLASAEDDDAEGSPAPQPRRRAPGEKSPRELFESYAQAPDASATLLFRTESWKKGNLDKAILQCGGAIIRCETLSTAVAATWARERAEPRHGHPITADAAAALLDAVGPDLARLDSELAKLALAVEGAGKGADAPITAETVRAMCGFSREEEVWSIQNGLMAGDAAAAMNNLHQALDISRHSPVLVGIAYLDLAKKLDGAARGLAARESPESINRRLRLWGPAGFTIINKARKLRPSTTAGLLKEAVEADRRQKTGQGEPLHILEGLTLRFASLLA